MTRTVAMPLAVLASVLAAVGGVVVARHFGESSGTPSSPKSRPTANCPATAADACATTVASRFGINLGEVPTLGAVPAGLRYERGWVVKASNGREVAEFDFRDPETHYIYSLAFVRMAPPAHDSAKVRVTAHGRRYRAVEDQSLGLRYVVYEPHVAVVVEVVGAPTLGTSVPRTAEALLDSVQLKTGQVDP